MEQPNPTNNPRHREPIEALASLREIAEQGIETEIVDVWDWGVRRYGHAFIAYLRIGDPESRTTDAVMTFENVYAGTTDNWDTLLDDHLKGMGWARPLKEFRDQLGIPDTYLTWNRDELIAAYKDVMEVAEEGGQLHVFVR